MQTPPSNSNAEPKLKRPFGEALAAGEISPLVVPFSLFFVLPLSLMRAFVLKKLWLWYMVPAFDIAPLRLVYAYGIVLALSGLRGPTPSSQGTMRGTLAQAVFFAFYILLLGWIGVWFV